MPEVRKKKSLGYTAEEVDSALKKSLLSYTNEEIDGKIADTDTDLSELNGYVSGKFPIVFSYSGYTYINTADSPVDVSAVLEGTTLWRRAIIDCSEGDIFKLQIDGGDKARAYTFISSDGVVLLSAESSEVKSHINATVTAPANSAKLIIQDKNTSGTNESYLLKDYSLESRISDTESLLTEKDLSSDISWVSGKAIKAGTTDDSDGGLSDSTVFKRTPYISLDNVSEFTITIPIYTTASGGRAKYGLAFYDDAEQCVGAYQMKLGDNSAEEVTLTVPEGATMFRSTYYDDSYTDYTYDKAFKYIPSYKGSVPNLNNRVVNLEGEVKDAEALLMTKDLSASMSWVSGQAIKFGTTDDSDGGTSNSSVFKRTTYILLDNVSEFTITIPVYITASEARAKYGLSFYSDDNTCVGGYQMKLGDKSAEEVTLQVPEGATKFRTTYYDDSYTGYTYDKDFVYIPKYKDSVPELFSKVNRLEDKVNSIKTKSLTHYNCIGSPTPYYVTKDSAYDFTVTLDNINNKFDEFVSTYPDIIAREDDIGYDQTGTYAMRHYVIKPMKPAIFSTRSDTYIKEDSNNDWDETNKDYGFRRILLTLGMHSGTEKESIKGTIAAIEEILSSSEDWAMFIKNNFIIDIVPCINPWGLVNSSSSNSSGINLNRDFKDLSQQETKNIKCLIDELVTKGLIGVVDTHNTTVGGDGYWVTKKSYKYYNDYVRMSQQLNRTITPLFKSLYGDNTYNGVHFYLWNYGSSETGQMHEYADSLGLLAVSCEARSGVDKTYLATKMIVPNIIMMFGTFEEP